MKKQYKKKLFNFIATVLYNSLLYAKFDFVFRDIYWYAMWWDSYCKIYHDIYLD
jgi:hypothetical protein